MESRVTLFTIVLSLITFSCTDQSTTPSKPGLLLESPTVTVTVMWYGSIAIRGGTGPIIITSIDDPTVADVSVTGPFTHDTDVWWRVSYSGKKIGRTGVHLSDEAGTATAVLFVTVARVAASPERIVTMQYYPVSTRFTGEITSLTIVQPPSPDVAVAKLAGVRLVIDPVGAGTTSVTIADGATPPNIVTVPVTVIASPWFTMPGTITLTTEWGTMTFHGILPVPRVLQPRTGNGAGGFLQEGSIAQIMGYRSCSPGPDEVFTLFFSYDGAGPATMTQPPPPGKNGYIYTWFRFGGDHAPLGGQDFSLTTARVTITDRTPTRIIGTFSGEGISAGRSYDSGHDLVTVYHGTFDVPLLFSLYPSGDTEKGPVWIGGNTVRDSLILNGPR